MINNYRYIVVADSYGGRLYLTRNINWLTCEHAQGQLNVSTAASERTIPVSAFQNKSPGYSRIETWNYTSSGFPSWDFVLLNLCVVVIEEKGETNNVLIMFELCY